MSPRFHLLVNPPLFLSTPEWTVYTFATTAGTSPTTWITSFRFVSHS